jgi:AP2 domain/Bacterial regulatory protein, arsR family
VSELIVSGRGKSKYKGVTWKKGKWVAQRKIRGRNKYLGSFRTEEAAAKAYFSSVEKFGEIYGEEWIGIKSEILNRIFDGPKTIEELAEYFEVHKETIRKPLRKMHKDNLVHIHEFRISELHSRQPTMVFAFGPGKDAVRVTFGEMQRKVTKVEKPAYIPPRHPLMAALFGEMAA